MAVLLPLFYIEGTANRSNQSLPNIYIISDSTYVVNTGNGEWKKTVNRPLWSAIAYLKTKMNLIFIHVNRNVLTANVFGDSISNTIRKYLCEIATELKTTPIPQEDGN